MTNKIIIFTSEHAYNTQFRHVYMRISHMIYSAATIAFVRSTAIISRDKSPAVNKMVVQISLFP